MIVGSYIRKKILINVLHIFICKQINRQKHRKNFESKLAPVSCHSNKPHYKLHNDIKRDNMSTDVIVSQSE